tara:strand:+ start:147 stop:389 length:243 start_codon:yes stop_codon:yes gene_type:complete
MPTEENTEEKNVTFEEIIETKEIETQSEPKFSLEEEDYKRLLGIISAATQKGAFSADEMYLTGLTYERVKKHVADNYPSN